MSSYNKDIEGNHHEAPQGEGGRWIMKMKTSIRSIKWQLFPAIKMRDASYYLFRFFASASESFRGALFPFIMLSLFKTEARFCNYSVKFPISFDSSCLDPFINYLLGGVKSSISTSSLSPACG